MLCFELQSLDSLTLQGHVELKLTKEIAREAVKMFIEQRKKLHSSLQALTKLPSSSRFHTAANCIFPLDFLYKITLHLLYIYFTFTIHLLYIYFTKYFSASTGGYSWRSATDKVQISTDIKFTGSQTILQQYYKYLLHGYIC